MFTTTTTTTTNEPRRGTRGGLIALVLGVCALAIPSSAVASYGSAPNEGSGSGSDNVSRNAGLVAPDHTTLNASLNSPDTSGADLGSPNVADSPSGYSSVNAISGAPADQPTFVSGSPSTGDEFDWADAALGAGVVMALVALGGAALIAVRRRSTMAPSTSIS